MVFAVALDECALSIDKLSLVFNLQPFSSRMVGGATEGDDDEFLKVVKDEGFEAISAYTLRQKDYRHSFHRSGIQIEHGCYYKDAHTSRISIVPCNVPDQLAWDSLSYILDLAKRDTIDISEIDVAVDLPVHLHHVQVLPQAKRKPNTFTGPRGLETIYLGSRTSSWSLKVYDKRWELYKKTGIAHDGPLTRFEVTRRNPDLDVHELSKLDNPFRRIGLAFMRGGHRDLEDQLLLDYAGLVGAAAIKPRLKPARWRRLASMLADDGGLSCPHPAEVFDARWPTVVAQLQRRMPLLGSRP